MTNRISEDRAVFPFRGTRGYFHENVELPFFNYYLKDEGTLSLSEALVFETGTDLWRSYDKWPPANAKEREFFFTNDGHLSWVGPPAATVHGFDEYVSDPAKSVPYTLQTSVRYNRDYFVDDQRFAACRPHVVVYTSEPLVEKMTIVWPIAVELYVTTTETDADWVVKVIDVFPENTPDPEVNPRNIRMGGYQRLIREDVIRGKFRKSLENPEPFVPGRVTKVAFELPDVAHTFLQGHRIMVQVQNSWFPLIERNLQTFCNIRMADDKDFRKATHRICRTPQFPSGIKVLAIAES
jgi:putative CocE/NonD family hydrolase